MTLIDSLRYKNLNIFIRRPVHDKDDEFYFVNNRTKIKRGILSVLNCFR